MGLLENTKNKKKAQPTYGNYTQSTGLLANTKAKRQQEKLNSNLERYGELVDVSQKDLAGASMAKYSNQAGYGSRMRKASMVSDMGGVLKRMAANTNNPTYAREVNRYVNDVQDTIGKQNDYRETLGKYMSQFKDEYDFDNYQKYSGKSQAEVDAKLASLNHLIIGDVNNPNREAAIKERDWLYNYYNSNPSWLSNKNIVDVETQIEDLDRQIAEYTQEMNDVNAMAGIQAMTYDDAEYQESLANKQEADHYAQLIQSAQAQKDFLQNTVDYQNYMSAMAEIEALKAQGYEASDNYALAMLYSAGSGAWDAGVNNIAAFTDATLGKPLRALENKVGFTGVGKWIGDLYGATDMHSEINKKYSAMDSYEYNSGIEKFGMGASNAIGSALPTVLVAVATGGTSSASAAKSVGSYLKGLAKNPQFWTSFVNIGGATYDSAIEEGATYEEALATALLNGALGSAVEISGGFETKLNNSNTFSNWLKSAVEEGGEEVIQGVLENGLKKMVYDHDRAVMSTNDANAIINPVRMAQEFGYGAVAGGVLSGANIGVSSAVNAGVNVYNKNELAQSIKQGTSYDAYKQYALDNELIKSDKLNNSKVVKMAEDVENHIIEAMNSAENLTELRAAYANVSKYGDANLKNVADIYYEHNLNRIKTEVANSPDTATFDAEAENTSNATENVREKVENEAEHNAQTASVVTTDGNNVNITGIVEVKNGDITVSLSDGTEANVSDLTFIDREVEKVWGAALSYNDINIAKSITANYKGDTYADAYIESYGHMLNIGKMGLDYEASLPIKETTENLAGVVGARSAYTFGKQMYEQSKKAEGKAHTPTKKAKAQYTKSEGVEETALDTVYEAISKKLGIEVKKVKKIMVGENAEVNAQLVVATASILISEDSDSEFANFIHELGEYGLAYNPKEYIKLRTAICDYAVKLNGAKNIDQLIKNKQKVYAKVEGNETYNEAMNEVVNDVLGGLFSTDEGVSQFMEWLQNDSGYSNKEQKTIIQKLCDLLKSIADAIKNIVKTGKLSAANKVGLEMQGERAMKIRSQFLKMLEDAKENIEQEKGVASDSSKFSIKKTTDGRKVAVIDSNILKGVARKDWNKVVRNELSKIKFIQVRNDIIGINAKTKGEMLRSEYTEWLKKNAKSKYYHKLQTAPYLTDVIEASTGYVNEKPKHARKDNFESFARGNVLLQIGEKQYSAEVVVGITNRQRMTFYDIVGINDTNFEIKKEGAQQYSTRTNVQTVESAMSYPSNDKVSQEGNPVNKKNSLKDSEGSNLTEAQAEYFKDSKIRDEEGNLKVMYHGSGESFTVFDKKKAKSSGYYGSGFYFTSSESHAKQYGSNYKVYLNITNPMQEGTHNITKAQFKKFVEAVAENDDYGIENYGYGATVDSVVNDVYGKDDFGMITDINASCIGDMVEAIQLFNEVNGTDYNGIIVPTETVAFYPNQIKNVDNLNPTENEDIRYSLRELNEDDYSEIKDFFGTTKNYKVAGYLLKDGSMLDFSGKHWGDTNSNMRSVDHREVWDVWENDDTDGTEEMVNMISNGNIRLMPESGGINLSAIPTKEQKATLTGYIKSFAGRVVVDIDEVGGDTIKSLTYDKGTSAESILGDIEEYFEKGIKQQSDLMAFHTKYSLKNNFSYEELITKEPIKVANFGNNDKIVVPTKQDGTVDSKEIVAKVREKCKRKETYYYVEVPDLNSNVLITNDAIRHGYIAATIKKKSADSSAYINAKVALFVPEVLANSVEVNQKNSRNMNSYEYASVMLGLANIEGKLYAVRSVIERNAGGKLALTEYGIIDNLYAVNEKESKSDNTSVDNHLRDSELLSEYNVSDVLGIVKNIFDDTLSEDVYAHFGMKRRKTDFSEGKNGDNKLLFSLKEDTIPENSKDLSQSDKYKAQVEALSSIFDITKGKQVKIGALRGIASKIRKDYNSSYDYNHLVTDLRLIYDYASSGKVSMNDLMSMAQMLSKIVLDKSSNNMEISDDAKKVLRDIKAIKIMLSPAQKKEVSYYYDSYNDYRKQHFGKLDLRKEGRSLDSVWQELSEMYPEWFDADVNELDQPIRLAEIVKALSEDYQSEEGFDIEDASAYMTLELFQAYFTALDNQISEAHKKELAKVRSKYLKGMADIKIKAKAKYEAALKEVKQSDKEKLSKLRADKNAKLAEQRAKLNMKKRDAVSKVREGAEKAKVKKNIVKNARDIITWINAPTDKKHVPESMRRVTLDFLTAIDFVSPNASEDSQNTLKWKARMEALRVKLLEIENNKDNENASEEYASIINDIDPDLMPMVEEFINNNKDAVNISELDVAQLKELNKIVTSLKYAITNANKMYANKRSAEVGEVSRESIVYLDSLKRKKYQNKLVRSVSKLLNIDMLDAPSYFDMVGTNSIYDELREGFNKRVFDIQNAQEYMRNLLNEVDVKKWGKEVHTFHDVDGRAGEITTQQLMSLYSLLKREQARGHIFGEGIKIAEDKSIKNMQVKPYHFDEETITELINNLTEEQKRVADAMQQYMSNVSSEWGNEVSMEMYGYKKFTEKFYFPIASDGNTLQTNDKTENKNGSLYAIRNQGMTKALTKNARNAITITDIFDVFSEHIVGMANYHAFALPLTDAMKWFNYKEASRRDNGIVDTFNLKESIEGAFGKEGQAYFTNLVRAINGEVNNKIAVGLEAFMGNYKAASVSANIRVVVQQPTSYIRAAMVINPKHLTKGVIGVKNWKESIEECHKYSAIALWKSWGYYETMIGQSMKEVITGQKTTYNKLKDVGMKPAQMADNITWGVLWNAVKSEQMEAHPELDIHSEEFKTLVAKRFDEVIDATQVVDTVFHRSQIMRDKSMSMFTAFMAEPTKSYNMIHNQIMKLWQNAGDKEARRKLARAISTFLVTSFFTAAAQSLVDAFRYRNDDEYERWCEQFLEEMKGNYIENINPINMIPVVKEFYPIIATLTGAEYYQSSRMDTAFISDVTTFLNVARKYATGECDYTAAYLIKTGSKAVSSISGLPVYNVFRTFNTLYNNIAEEPLPMKKSDVSKAEINNIISSLKKNGKADFSSLIETKKAEYLKKYPTASDSKAESEAEQSVRNMVTSAYKKDYVAAYKNGYSKQMATIEKELRATKLYDDVDSTVTSWVVSELKTEYMKATTHSERTKIRQLLYKTGKWSSLSELDKQLEEWRN